MLTSTRKRAFCVVTTMEREGVNAKPTMLGPERNCSGLRPSETDDAAAAGERGGDVQAAFGIEGHALAGGRVRDRTISTSPAFEMRWTESKLEVVGPVT